MGISMHQSFRLSLKSPSLITALYSSILPTSSHRFNSLLGSKLHISKAPVKIESTHGIIITLPLSSNLPLANSQETKQLESKHDNKNSNKRDHSSNSTRLNIGQTTLGGRGGSRVTSFVEFTTFPHLCQSRVCVGPHLSGLDFVLA
jgi:hypothetical protein